jgi:hypothetical protein
MRPEKGTSLGGNASFEPSTMEIGFTRLTCGGEQENNMTGKERKEKERKGLEREAMHKKSQKCYISRSCGGGTPSAISMKFGSLVYMSQRHQFCEV